VAVGQQNMPPVAAESIAVHVTREDVQKRRAAPDVLERQECKRFRRVFQAVREADASASGRNTLPATTAEIKAPSAEMREILKTVTKNQEKLQTDLTKVKKDISDLKKKLTNMKKDASHLKKYPTDVKVRIGESYQT
jgi:predicted nuclease with TOPRIM domain